MKKLRSPKWLREQWKILYCRHFPLNARMIRNRISSLQNVVRQRSIISEIRWTAWLGFFFNYCLVISGTGTFVPTPPRRANSNSTEPVNSGNGSRGDPKLPVLKG